MSLITSPPQRRWEVEVEFSYEDIHNRLLHPANQSRGGDSGNIFPCSNISICNCDLLRTMLSSILSASCCHPSFSHSSTRLLHLHAIWFLTTQSGTKVKMDSTPRGETAGRKTKWRFRTLPSSPPEVPSSPASAEGCNRNQKHWHLDWQLPVNEGFVCAHSVSQRLKEDY